MKFNRPRCSHVCLLWYGSSQVSSAIGKNNQNSEWFFIIIWEPLSGTGMHFRKKWKHCIFFNRTSGPICCFYRTFTFFIGKTDKTDSFQELWVQKMYLIRKLVRDRTADVFFKNKCRSWPFLVCMILNWIYLWKIIYFLNTIKYFS